MSFGHNSLEESRKKEKRNRERSRPTLRTDEFQTPAVSRGSQRSGTVRGTVSGAEGGEDDDHSYLSNLTPERTPDAENDLPTEVQERRDLVTVTTSRRQFLTAPPPSPPPTPDDDDDTNDTQESEEDRPIIPARREILHTQEVSGRPVEETAPPANDNIGRLLLDRDRVQRLLDDFEERIQLETLSEAHRQAMSLPSSNITLEHGLEIEGEFEDNSIGNVVCIEDGSIILKIRMTSMTEIRNFLAKFRDGSLKDIIATWLEGPAEDVVTNVQIEVDDQKCELVKQYYHRDCLEDKVDFTFCPVSCLWLWTADRKVWHKINEIVVREGPDKGKRPQEADLQMFHKLNKMNTKFFMGLQPCAICENISHMEHPDFAGNINLIEVDVRVTYTCTTDDQCVPPLRNKNGLNGFHIRRPSKRPANISMRDLHEEVMQVNGFSALETTSRLTPKSKRPMTLRSAPMNGRSACSQTFPSTPPLYTGGASDGEDSPSCASSTSGSQGSQDMSPI